MDVCDFLRTQSAGDKYRKWDPSEEFWILTFLVKQRLNRMQAEKRGRRRVERCEVFSEEMSSQRALWVTLHSWPGWKGQTIIWESGGRKVKTERGQNRLAAGEADWGNAHRNLTGTHCTTSPYSLWDGWDVTLASSAVKGKKKRKKSRI